MGRVYHVSNLATVNVIPVVVVILLVSTVTDSIASGTNISDLDTKSNNRSEPKPVTQSTDMGTFQLKYTGLVRSEISPEVATALGLNDTFPGFIITDVLTDSPAEKAGIRGANSIRMIEGEMVRLGGDIIDLVYHNSTVVKDNEALVEYLENQKRVGENITLTLLRDGAIRETNLTLSSLPEYLWYTDVDEGIRIKYPVDWDIGDLNLAKDEIIKFFSPENNPQTNFPAAAVFVNLFPSEGVTLDELAIREEEGSENTRTLDVRGTELSMAQAYESIYYEYMGNTTLKNKSVFTIEDDQIYRISFVADPTSYENYLPMFEEMLRSFRIDKES